MESRMFEGDAPTLARAVQSLIRERGVRLETLRIERLVPNGDAAKYLVTMA
jgi:hypothetical protein